MVDGQAVYGDASAEDLAARTGSSPAYGDDGAVGSAGPGGEYEGDGSYSPSPATYPAHPAGGAPIMVSTPATPVVYAPATAVQVQNLFVWYKPWTWRHRQPSGRLASWRNRRAQAAANAHSRMTHGY